MTRTISRDKFRDLWLDTLSEQQRKTRVEAAFRITRAVAKKQIDLIKEFIKEEKPGNPKFVYFYETVKSIWEHVDFALSLGKGKNRRFAFYPTRTVFENTFRLEHFSHQKKDVQEKIAIKELLRITKRHYYHEMANNDTAAAQEFKDYYNEFSKDKFSDIDTINIKNLEPFPSMWVLTKNSKIDGAGAWYFHYQALAEETHGKLMSLISIRQNEERAYRLSLMYLLIMTNDVLKNADFHLKGATRKEVVESIQKAEAIIKKPIKYTKKLVGIATNLSINKSRI